MISVRTCKLTALAIAALAGATPASSADCNCNPRYAHAGHQAVRNVAQRAPVRPRPAVLPHYTVLCTPHGMRVVRTGNVRLR